MDRTNEFQSMIQIVTIYHIDDNKIYYNYIPFQSFTTQLAFIMKTCLRTRCWFSVEEKPVFSGGWNFVESEIFTSLVLRTISMHDGNECSHIHTATGSLLSHCGFTYWLSFCRHFQMNLCGHKCLDVERNSIKIRFWVFDRWLYTTDSCNDSRKERQYLNQYMWHEYSPRSMTSLWRRSMNCVLTLSILCICTILWY